MPRKSSSFYIGQRSTGKKGWEKRVAVAKTVGTSSRKSTTVSTKNSHLATRTKKGQYTPPSRLKSWKFTKGFSKEQVTWDRLVCHKKGMLEEWG